MFETEEKILKLKRNDTFITRHSKNNGIFYVDVD